MIVPSFNQGRFIRATLDSILAQDYRPLEIHVVDGASRDETVEVLQSYGQIPELFWTSEPDSGVVEAVNKGFTRVHGDIVAIQSSDDCYLPGAISAAVNAFQNHPEAGLIYGNTVKVDEFGRELGRSNVGPWSLENLFLLKTWIPQPSCFFRRQLLNTCGGWDERIPYAADTGLWIRIAFHTQVRKIDKCLSQRRMHDSQRDTHSDRVLRDYRKLIANSPEIAAASPHLRRAARSGAELIYRRYNPTGSELRAFWHDLKGMVICPSAFDARRLWAYGVVLPTRRLLQPLAPFKRWLGCWLNERWQAEIAMSPLASWVGMEWRDLCNRNEKVEPGDDKGARYVDTEYTSYLTVARQFPSVGGRLAKKALEENSLPALDFPNIPQGKRPKVSVIIPVGGKDRLPGFRCVLAALSNQSLREIEIIVLEHSQSPAYPPVIPVGVRYEHFPRAEPAKQFNKSMLLNRGVDLARASVVLLHDADIVVPRTYLASAMNRINSGFEATRPLRFLFYLDEALTKRLTKSGNIGRRPAIPLIAQNSQGGSTLIRKKTYEAIGGHDERFFGWGGEDLEFLERLRTRHLFRGGYMPALHLWHVAAPTKSGDGLNQKLLAALRAEPPEHRIERLTALQP